LPSKKKNQKPEEKKKKKKKILFREILQTLPSFSVFKSCENGDSAINPAAMEKELDKTHFLPSHFF